MILLVIFGILSIMSSFIMLICTRIVYRLLSFMSFILCITFLYILEGSSFLAFSQIIIYSGAIIILFLMGIMLVGIHNKDVSFLYNLHFKYILLILLYISSLVYIICISKINHSAIKNYNSSLKDITNSIFDDYGWIFQISGILLVVVAIAAIQLTSKIFNNDSNIQNMTQKEYQQYLFSLPDGSIKTQSKAPAVTAESYNSEYEDKIKEIDQDNN